MGGRHHRVLADHLGHVRALLRVRIRRRAIRGKVAWQPRPVGRAAGIMAAVVGVIANLAIYFAIHTLFSDVTSVTWGPVNLQLPEPGSLKPLSLMVAAFAALLLFRAKWSVLRTLGACALIGLAAGLIELLAT